MLKFKDQKLVIQLSNNYHIKLTHQFMFCEFNRFFKAQKWKFIKLNTFSSPRDYIKLITLSCLLFDKEDEILKVAK